jgi:hypothetical protein
MPPHIAAHYCYGMRRICLQDDHRVSRRFSTLPLFTGLGFLLTRLLPHGKLAIFRVAAVLIHPPRSPYDVLWSVMQWFGPCCEDFAKTPI